MSGPGAEFPPVELPYSLRATLCALDDLGIPRRTVSPGDLDDVSAATKGSDIVEKFRDLRSESPYGTEAPMNNVGVPDVFSLHGPFGERAATWFDEANHVCWLLGVVGQHGYKEFEQRAANGELLPSASDYDLLNVDSGDFAGQVAPGLAALINRALQQPEHPQRGEVGGLLRLEISVMAVPVDDEQLVDLYMMVRVPPVIVGAKKPGNWPGHELMEVLAQMATGEGVAKLDTLRPQHVPDGPGRTRPVDWKREMAIVVRGLCW